MKLAILITACMAIVAVRVQSASIPEDHTVVSKMQMEKQRFIFDIFYRVSNDLSSEEYIKFGGKLINDQSMYTKYTEQMMQFENFFKNNGLVPQGEFFSTVYPEHMQQAYSLFEYFFYAKDYDTFVHNVVFARMHVNEGMFVYALTLAVIHREDMQGIILPQIYEIFPQMFFGSKYILAAEKFDFDTFNRQIMLEKELKTIYDQEYPNAFFGKGFYMKDWKVWQWWKLMGLDDGFQVESHSMRSGNQKSADPMFSAIYSKLKMFYLPVDYTRDYGIFNADSKMSYFTEDVGFNAYWYYLNLDYPMYLPGKMFNMDKDRHSEVFIYNVRQILARYYMERLSQGLGRFDSLSWYGAVDTGYDSQLVAYNGVGFTARKNYYEIDSNHNYGVFSKIISIESSIDNMITTGQFVMKDGSAVDLTKPESIKYFANFLQGNINIDQFDKVFFGYYFALANQYLSGQEYSEFTIDPHVLANYETMFRDPVTFSLLKNVAIKFYQFQYNKKPYTREELILPGVQINDIEVSKLMTYFDLVDIDVSTLQNDKIVYHEGKMVFDKSLLFRQQRLNHKEFTYTANVQADKPQKVVVRSFIGPAFDEYGQKLNLYKHPENYMEFDEFAYELVAGANVIKRSSKDFTWTSSDPYTYSELYNYLDMSFEGKYQFQPNISQSHSLFPDRLILPHGWVKGMPMVMFFAISPFNADFEQYSSYDPYYLSGIGSGVRHIDNMPFGYPLDRKIEDYSEFYTPNMFYKIVKIYHVDNLDKYYPFKYEHYGTFDEEF